MDNYKIKVNDEAESKEAQELFVQLGYSNRQSKRFGFVYTQNGEIGCDSMEHWAYYNDLCQELTLPKLRDLVVLKRGDVKDATHEDQYGDKWLYLDERHYVYLNDQWDLPIGEFLERYELKPILPVKKQDPALISGADALRALADGKEVEANNSDFGYWIDARNLSVKDFFDDIHIFRLKPQTIKLELELPKPFEPEEDCHVYILDDGKTDGYRRYSYEVHGDKGNTFIGIWRTEEEIKQVVEQLRKIRGTNS
ncbi:hypothetical protein DOL94_10480 [Acinetobacter baumannii]|uniref:Uncharacterized protein n=1 Tax=Acinetobacter baumannii TaxID=470 RepID=A0A3F3MSA1_ACIBA|nr:hypothetical protein [Acinetobacter baumannii]PZM16594.1 hypothetical protein DOL94_10480 [Acinetobacter baumannii]